MVPIARLSTLHYRIRKCNACITLSSFVCSFLICFLFRHLSFILLVFHVFIDLDHISPFHASFVFMSFSGNLAGWSGLRAPPTELLP